MLHFLSHLSRRRLCLFAFAAAGILVLFAAAITSRPPVALSVVGLETKTFKVEPATNVMFIHARLQMTNCGKRPVVLYCLEYGITAYSILTRTNGIWKELWDSKGCGIGERILAPGQTVTFTAVAMDLREPFQIAVPYRTLISNRKSRRFLPVWLINHVAWLRRDPMVTTPTITLPIDNT